MITTQLVRSITSSCVLFLVVLILPGWGCADRIEMEQEPGISEELAALRKKEISNIHYAITLEIPAEKAEPIPGFIAISFELGEKIPVVLDFNAEPEGIKGVVVNGKAQKGYIVKNEHILIAADEVIAGSNKIEVEFIAGDQSLNRNADYLYTLFVPDRASTCFPLFDQPDLKARFSLSLRVPADWEAISNEYAVQESSNNGWKTIKFNQSDLMSSYLFAFAAGKFYKVEREVEGRPVVMLHRETDSVKVAENIDEVFGLHARSIAWMEKYTDIDYPFNKFGFALIPSFQYGGMEHPGAIFYRASSLLLDQPATEVQELRRAGLIAHETAHMWFGNLVTMEWFSDVWLKEVFANYMRAKMVNPQFPEVNHQLGFLLSHYPGAYDVDRTTGTHPVRQELHNLKNAGTMYGAIIYQKAPVLMKQLELMIGEETMQKCLAEYLQTYKNGNASWDDLVAIFDKNSTLDITNWSNQWVYGKGMPEIEVGKDGSDWFVGTGSNSHWPQMAEYGLVDESGNTTARYLVDWSKDHRAKLPWSNGLVVPNTNGQGYGYFKMEQPVINYLLSNISTLDDPVMRASSWINLYEGVLRGDVQPYLVLETAIKSLKSEKENQVTNRLISYIQSLFWRFITDDQRKAIAHQLEYTLISEVVSSGDAGEKAMLFRAFRNIVTTPEGVDKLRAIHLGKEVYDGLVLAENDQMINALELAVREVDDWKEILDKQLAVIENPDRKRKMEFLIPVVSADVIVRDQWFEGLSDPANREQEPWVEDGLRFLHHPLRRSEAVKYILPGLELLEEIQRTGDIFFPKRWLDNMYQGHHSMDVVKVTDQFLKDRPDYPEKLKNKLLQSVDDTKRAAAIIEELSEKGAVY